MHTFHKRVTFHVVVFLNSKTVHVKTQRIQSEGSSRETSHENHSDVNGLHSILITKVINERHNDGYFPYNLNF